MAEAGREVLDNNCLLAADRLAKRPRILRCLGVQRNGYRGSGFTRAYAGGPREARNYSFGIYQIEQSEREVLGVIC